MDEQLGPYRLLEELGRGGMGAVYRARDTRSGGEVALKVMLDLDANPTQLERFRREAEAVQGIEHPHLVRVLELGFSPPRAWAAFELVEGETLAARVARDGPLPWREAVAVLAEVADGLAAAHARRLLHRDVKPANVLLGPEGAKLADFGLVKDLDRESLTETGATLGSPGYLAPEQIGGQRDLYGPPTDVYGLAATLYCALTGEAPYRGPTVIATLTAALRDPPPRPQERVADVPAWLDALCVAGLAKLPEERPSGARAFRDALRGGLATGSRRRLPSLASLAAAGALALLAGGLGVLLTRDRLPEQLDLAAARAGTGDVPGARELLHHAAEAYPSRPEVWAALGRLELEAWRLDEAELRLSQGAESAPSAAVLGLRAAVRLEQGELVGARADAERALALDPEEPVAVRVLAAFDFTADRLEEARRGFERAYQGGERSPRLYGEFSQVLAALGEAEAALRLVDEGVDRWPGSCQLLLLRGSFRLRAGDREGARADLEATRELTPREAGGHLLRARLLRSFGRPAQAVVAAERAVELGFETPSAWTLVGELRFELRRFEGALLALRRASALQPDSAELRVSEAQCLFALDRPTEALQVAEELLARDPHAPDALAVQAEGLSRTGSPGRALAVLDAGDPGSEGPFALYVRSRVLANLGRLGEEEAVLDRLLDAEPDHLARLRRGKLRLMRDDWAGALEDAELVLRSSPETRQAERVAVEAAGRLGDYERVVAGCERLISREPQVALHRRMLAGALMRLERPEEARAELERGLQVLPGDPGLQADRQRLLERLGGDAR